MRWLGLWVLTLGLSCSSPTEPVPAGYTGEWAGTTDHGTPVQFHVADDHVQSFTVTLNQSPSCSATETIPGPAPIAPREDNNMWFTMSKVHGNFEWGAALYGTFTSDRRSASGEFVLVRYPGCGTLMFRWSASRR